MLEYAINFQTLFMPNAINQTDPIKLNQIQ